MTENVPEGLVISMRHVWSSMKRLSIFHDDWTHGSSPGCKVMSVQAGRLWATFVIIVAGEAPSSQGNRFPG